MGLPIFPILTLLSPQKSKPSTLLPMATSLQRSIPKGWKLMQASSQSRFRQPLPQLSLMIHGYAFAALEPLHLLLIFPVGRHGGTSFPAMFLTYRNSDGRFVLNVSTPAASCGVPLFPAGGM